MYSDYWYNDDQRGGRQYSDNYWIALRQQVMFLLIETVGLDAERRLDFFHKKGVEEFDNARHLYGTIMQLAVDGDIIVPPDVDIGWDGDLMTVTSFVRNVLATYGLPHYHTSST